MPRSVRLQPSLVVKVENISSTRGLEESALEPSPVVEDGKMESLHILLVLKNEVERE